MKNSLLICSLLYCFLLHGQSKKVNAKEFPYNNVVKLLMYKDGNAFHGTGVILNKNSILTNAHNVYKKDSIKIYPGYSKKESSPFGIIKVDCKRNETIFYSDIFESNPNDLTNDFAIIKYDNDEVYNKMLKKSNGKKFELKYVSNLNEETINIAGYPFYRFFEFWKPKKAKVQFKNKTNKFNITNKVLLNYKLNTRGGSSGSPIWIIKNDTFILIGLHKSGKGFKNQGIWYDKDRIALIKKWMK